MKTERAKQHNSLERQLELASADKPKPPSDFADYWDARHWAVFDEYLTGRAWADWHPPMLRLISQAVDLEIQIREAHALVRKDGLTVYNSTGSQVQHPALGIVTKLSTTQGNLLRRLGIAVDGVSSPRDIKKNAAKAQELQAREESPVGRLLA